MIIYMAQFIDTDLQKLQDSDDDLIDVYSPNDLPPQESEVIPPVAPSVPEVVPPVAPNKWTEDVGEEEDDEEELPSPPIETPPVKPVAETPKDLDDELKAIFDEIEKSQQGLSTAIETGDIWKIKEENENMKNEMAKKMKEIETYNQQIEYLQKIASDIKKEKDLSEVENKYRYKLLEGIEWNDNFKSMVVYKQKAETDPAYKSKYENAIKEYVKAELWIDIEDIVATKNRAEKSAMSWNNYTFQWNIQPQSEDDWLEDVFMQ